MRSPIFPYLKNIPDSLINIAPERKQEILDIVERNQIKFIADDKTSFIFSVNTVNNEIHFSIPALEYVRASAYTYWITYQEAYAAKRKEIKKIDIPIS